ncbi:MAG TPA: hypothetical protein VNV44_09780 [Solirubrobacteraceae bacterium]|jgi:hypothetical protein|nr:hypothetical protein [Solirubrobacteraceae bacterium]
MPQRQPMDDLVVILPGITGSALSVKGKAVWDVSGSAVVNGVRALGRSVDKLRLPDGFGNTLPIGEQEGEPEDGVHATRLIGGLHFIPGVWSPVKGYEPLVRYFLDEFVAFRSGEGRPGNLLEFPYDWRLSNVVSARRLLSAIGPELETWRRQDGKADAKLVLVCHSMGGLVARWFLEKLGGWEYTRWLITIGTPYQGSMMAVDALGNGLRKGPKWFGKNLTPLVRSFPSMYELLPAYKCWDTGNGSLARLVDARGHGLDAAMLAAGAKFHDELSAAVAARPERGYRTMAIKGVTQPTFLTAKAGAGRIELVRSYGGTDKGGDGTVPRPSAHPPEWASELDGEVIGYSQRHAALQETPAVLTQLFTRLTAARLGAFMGEEDFGLDLPHSLQAGEDLRVEGFSKHSNLPVQLTVTGYETREGLAQSFMSPLGEGSYEATFGGLPPGAYEIEATGPVGTVTSVRDVFVIWP